MRASRWRFCSFGAHLNEALRAAEDLEARGIGVTVVDARFAKPLDTDLIDALAANHAALITIEQGAVLGFGGMVLHHLAASGRLDHGLAIRTMTLPDRFIDQASPAGHVCRCGSGRREHRGHRAQCYGRRNGAVRTKPGVTPFS